LFCLPVSRSKTSKEHEMSSKHRSRKLKDWKEPALNEAKIGFLGAGKMTESIVAGIMSYCGVPAQNIFITAPTEKNLEKFRQMSIKTSKRNIDLFAKFDCEIIFLACHGSVVADCYNQGGTRPHPITVNHIPKMDHPVRIMSLISGFGVDQIRKVLLNPEHGDKYQIEMHRVSVNCSVAYGKGIWAIDCEPDSDTKLSNVLRTLMSSTGSMEYVPESQMDAACAITGSGLAFSFYIVSAMSDGAFKMGLARPMAIKLASKTMRCAAQSVLESGKHPSELRDAVCAAKGAAIYGIHILDKAEVQSGITAAVEAAHKRAQELAQAKK